MSHQSAEDAALGARRWLYPPPPLHHSLSSSLLQIQVLAFRQPCLHPVIHLAAATAVKCVRRSGVGSGPLGRLQGGQMAGCLLPVQQGGGG
jgi:hypothetical protein